MVTMIRRTDDVGTHTYVFDSKTDVTFVIQADSEKEAWRRLGGGIERLEHEEGRSTHSEASDWTLARFWDNR